MNTTEYESALELIWEIENNPDPENAIQDLNEIIAQEAGYTFKRSTEDDPYDHFYDPDGKEIDFGYETARWEFVGQNCKFATNSDLCWTLPLENGYFFEVTQAMEEPFDDPDGEFIYRGYGAEIRFCDDSDPRFIKSWTGETLSRLPSLAMITAWINMRHDLYNKEMRR